MLEKKNWANNSFLAPKGSAGMCPGCSLSLFLKPVFFHPKFLRDMHVDPFIVSILPLSGYTTVFIHSLVNGHLSCGLCGASANETSVVIHLQVFLGPVLSFFLGKYPGVTFLGSFISVKRLPNCFQSGHCTVPSAMRVTLPPHPLHYLYGHSHCCVVVSHCSLFALP